ncbi:hypothetical protein RF640_16410 [Kocuria sp. CPCC 205231]|uniref:hypothetical protein n=1 Tax=Kocuria sp. CPCC 205231 TaxID=3073551 RepID=UPI0034D4A354
MIDLGKYKIVNALSDDSQMPRRLILDTNFLIDIGRYYFQKRSQEDRDNLKAALKAFPHTGVRGKFIDVNYGFALLEASVSRTGFFRESVYHRWGYAIDKVLMWNADEIEKNFDNRHPPANRDNYLKKNLKPRCDSVKSTSMPNVFVIAYYAHILYICSLESRRKDGEDPLSLLKEYSEWSKNILGVRDPYCASLAISWLAGDREMVRGVKKLIKYSGSESPDELSDKCWNAGWDVWLVSLTEGFTFGFMDPERRMVPTGLLTANLDPFFLRSRAENRSVINIGKSLSIPFVGVSSSLNLRYPSELVWGMFPFDLESDPLRMTRDGSRLLEQMVDAVHVLEQKLKISCLTHLPTF